MPFVVRSLITHHLTIGGWNYERLYRSVRFTLLKKNIRAYCRLSQRIGKVMKDLGALEYREFVGDDLMIKGTTGFPSKIKLKRGGVLLSAVVGFRSKAHRNTINNRLMQDPRMLRLIKEFQKTPLFDSRRMLYGGFATMVKV